MKAISVFFVLMSVLLIFVIGFGVFGVVRGLSRKTENTQLPQPQNTVKDQPATAIQMDEWTESNLPAGYWRARLTEGEEIWSYRRFSLNGQYKWYIGAEPEGYDGMWFFNQDKKIEMAANTFVEKDKVIVKSYHSVLTMEKNEKGRYIMKEIYNGNPIVWEWYKAEE